MLSPQGCSKTGWLRAQMLGEALADAVFSEDEFVVCADKAASEKPGDTHLSGRP